MLTYRLNRISIVAVTATVLCSSLLWGQTAEFYNYTDPSGENVFALSVTPGSVPSSSAARDVVLVADTSASMQARFRDQEMSVISMFAGSLNPATDRICLLASDTDTVQMTPGFVSPDSKEFKDAVSALEQRVPLGASDMESTLKTIAVCPFDANKNKSVVYLGQGASRARTLSGADFNALCKDLVDKKIPVSSVAMGPSTDLRVLNCLALQTGGKPLSYANPDADNSADIQTATSTVVSEMDSATSASVVWPDEKSVALPADFQIFPQQFPPLRSDRDTMLVGKYKGNGPFDVKVNTSAGEQNWNFAPSNTADRYSYVKQLVDYAADGPLPLVSKNDMDKARDAASNGIERLNQLATKALDQNDLDQAGKLADQALLQDPNDTNAQIIKDTIEAKREAANGGGGPLNLAGGPGEEIFMDNAGLLETVDESVNAITQQVIGEVTNAINDARASLRVDPEGAVQNLKNQREAVRRNADISAANKEQLCRNLEAAIKEAQNMSEQITARNAEAARRIAEAQDRKILAEQMMNQQEKMNQMGKRFESLCKEKKYEQAQDVVVTMADQIDNLDKDKATAVAGILWARNVDNYVKQVQTRSLKWKNTADTLYQVDKASIPFPDEPPITYPDAEVWKRLTARRREKYNSMDLAQSGEKEKGIMTALKEPTSMDFTDMPLEDVINELKAQHHIEIQLDHQALQEAMITPEELPAVKKSLQGISLRAALKLMLSDLGLAYVIEDEVLKITTPDKASSKLTTKVYPVADLVIPIQMPDMENVFSSMGSNSSSMSNSSFSGSGNNNNNGGFNSLPREMRINNAVKNAVGQDNFQAFNVVDDLSEPVLIAQNVRRPAAGTRARRSVTAPATSVAPAAASTVSTPATVEKTATPVVKTAPKVASSVQTIATEITSDGKVIVVPEDVKKTDFWKDYFKSGQANEMLVRNTALYFKHTNKYNDIIDMLQSAMLTGKTQPWMYETLALAQLCAGRPQAEYERTLMSAVDFCDNPQTMILIGVYMQRIGLHERALKVFREVAKNNPDLSEPYERALPIASITNNLEAKQWASLGILSLAWPTDKQYLYDKANDMANSIVADYKKSGKVQLANQFQKQIDEAKKRDCMIRVSWTGNADIDIAVEEPGGTVCSMQNVQTPAGGLFLGDAHAGQMGKQTNTMSETYVCPRGFNGDYRLLVKKVWGEVVGGKVKIELFAHVSADELNSGKGKKPTVGYVQLTDDQAGMMFALADGRRNAMASEQTLANAVQNQVSKAVLAQQLAQAFDPAVMQNIKGFVNADVDAGAVAAAEVYPFYRGGAVGYQPEIITLPTGTNLMAQAVVSADRRYVRITCVPLFSYIPKVSVFNYVTGESTDTSSTSATSL